jgi:antitoxin component YwqK of YwqJK toxin-antitoxin module
MTIPSLVVVVTMGLAPMQVMDLDDLVRLGEVLVHPGTLAPYSGQVERRWPGTPTGQTSRVLRERGTLVDGRWDGVHEWFHLSGELATRETYRNGRLDGPSETYFKTGQLSARESYTDGLLEGPYESYWHRGRLAERGQWSAGRPCGVWLSFGRTVTYPDCQP